MRLFSDRDRPVHLGPFPLERLERARRLPPLDDVPPMAEIPIADPDAPTSIVNATGEYQSMLDAIREGLVARTPSACPEDPLERSEHLKAFGYFNDASMVGAGPLVDGARLAEPRHNAGIATLAQTLRTQQTKTLAAGIDMIMADLKESMEAPPSGIESHTHALVYLYAFPRDPGRDERGTDWLYAGERSAATLQLVRASLRASETASVIANYLRVLGHSARAHSYTSTDVDLNRLTVAAGLATVENGELVNPYLGTRFGVAAVTTTFELVHDRPLVPLAEQPRRRTHGIAWWSGHGTRASRFTLDPYARRRYADGPHAFETLKHVDTPTTFIDEPRVPRVPKRTDMFARAQFGDMGKAVQAGATGGLYVRRAAPSTAQRRALGAFVPIQDGTVAPGPSSDASVTDPARAAANLKATAYFLGADAVGLSRCPDWTWYSHDASGEPIEPRHGHALSLIVDQGHETMEGASGDDWISVAQSMRAYLRFSLIGGVLARQVRNLGFEARSHTVLDGEVLQPPLLLLAGLGEVSRIGEVILNPFLGPRLKSGVVTMSLPVAHDRPIDFGLQRFCEGCNKCARECPSGAITAGPKTMFNGYEIWKSDSQKCATYRITTEGGAMCGRCMKTCPWNLEGLFAEVPMRWAAMKTPALAPILQKLDDAAGRGSLNPVKKWWWDLELAADGAYRPADKVNARSLQPELALAADEQTLAVYPAPLAPHPWPFPDPMEREKGIAAYRAMVSPAAYRERLANGDVESIAHRYDATRLDPAMSPVMRLVVNAAERLSDGVVNYVLEAPDGAPLPPWEAGSHIDLVVAPEYLRQYSLTGDPADRSRYEIGVLREEVGKGGSRLLHRIFVPGRRVFASRPINHFPLVEGAPFSVLAGGGIGITPMIAMAWRLHARGRPFSLHYSVGTRADAAYAERLAAVPWRTSARLHVSDEGTRVSLPAVMAGCAAGTHVYTCGPDAYMQAVMTAAAEAGVPEEARHLEYFAVPDEPQRTNEPFVLRLARSGRDVPVPADRSAADVLNEVGVPVDVKCSDGLCGVCACTLLDGDVDHRDHVLSARERASRIILCRSRGAEAESVVTIDL